MDYEAAARYYGRIGLVAAAEAPAPEGQAIGSPPTETPGLAPSPYFAAIVDPIDTSAVINLLALVPNEDGTGLRSYERKNGGWIESPDYIRDIKGLTPPSMVELDRETLLAVVEQIDKFDQNQEGHQEEGVLG